MYLCRENKDADQLCGYSVADLRLYFRIYAKAGFLMTRLVLPLAFSTGTTARQSPDSRTPTILLCSSTPDPPPPTDQCLGTPTYSLQHWYTGYR